MDSTIVVKINPQDAVPDGEQRVAWIERHGVMPTAAEVRATATLAEWQAAGAQIDPDGSVRRDSGGLDPDGGDYIAPYSVGRLVATAALRLIAETGRVPDEVPREIVSAELGRMARHTAARVAAEVASARSARDCLISQGLIQYLTAEQRQEMELITAEAAAAEKRDRDALEAAKRAAAEADRARARALREALDIWIEAHGTEAQRGRRRERLMSDAEVFDLLRDDLYRPLDEVPRYRRLEAGDVPHDADAREDDPQPEYETLSREDGDEVSLTDAQFAELGKIRGLAPTGATVDPRVHRGHCEHEECSGSVERTSALVTVIWHGHELSREYSLGE